MRFRQLSNLAFGELFCLKAKTNTKLFKNNSVVLMVFMVPSVTSMLMLLAFLTVLDSGTRKKTISWSVTAHNSNLFSQCLLTDQIEPVQAKFVCPLNHGL